MTLQNTYTASSNVQYGKSETYSFELDKERLDWLCAQTNRNKGQTQFLFQLVEGDFEKLKALEVQLKNSFVSYCPENTLEVAKCFAIKAKSNWFIMPVNNL